MSREMQKEKSLIEHVGQMCSFSLYPNNPGEYSSLHCIASKIWMILNLCPLLASNMFGTCVTRFLHLHSLAFSCHCTFAPWNPTATSVMNSKFMWKLHKRHKWNELKRFLSANGEKWHLWLVTFCFPSKTLV